jgi:hypothetical protein
MPGKMARSDPRPAFGLPGLLVAIHTSRQSCCKAGKVRIFTPVRESSGESRISRRRARGHLMAAGFARNLPPVSHRSRFFVPG